MNNLSPGLCREEEERIQWRERNCCWLFFGSREGGGKENEGSEDEKKEKMMAMRHWAKMAEEEGK